MDKKYFPEKIQTQRLVLKRNGPAHAKAMFHCVDQNRQHLFQFMPWSQNTKAIQDTKSYLDLMDNNWKEQIEFDYGIFRNDVYIGNFGVHSINWDREHCEIGYWISSEFEGAGYVSEALAAVEDVVFQIGFHRIEIRCSANNLRSAKVARNNGYALDGTLRELAIDNGQRVDQLLFSKLRSDRK